MYEEKYILVLGARLRNFKKVDTSVYQCSCPVCGDSKKDSTRARGNFFVHKGDWMYHCYNCDYSAAAKYLFKNYFPDIYTQFLSDEFGGGSKRGGRSSPANVYSGDDPEIDGFYEGTIPVLKLPKDHFAKEYVDGRKIPLLRQKELLYVPKFKTWVNKLIPGKFKSLEYDEPRLILPFYSESKVAVGLQGRSFNPKSKNKYITIKFNEDTPKIYGRNRVDASTRVLVVEGPIDSLFLHNAVADAGSGMKSAIKKYAKRVLIWDNEPHSEQILKKMSKAITSGENVCIWKPSNRFNDINDMVLGGMSQSDIMKEIKDRTFSGLPAKLELSKYRKIK